MVQEILLGTCGSFEIELDVGRWVTVFGQYPVGRRERPQDARIQYGTFLRLGMQLPMPVDAAIEAAVLVVNHFFKPEMQDVGFQHILHL